MAARLDCANAFQRIALDCVADIRVHHGGACSGDAEAVHQMRVAITRLRAAVSFFAPMTTDAAWSRLKVELAWLNVLLGDTRDSDVLADYAGQQRYRAWITHVGGQRLNQRRMRDHGRLAIALHSVRYRRLMSSLSGWIQRGPWLKDSKDIAFGGRDLRAYSEWKLRRWHKRLSRKGRHLATLDASRRHRLRIRVKRFRYMLEALARMLPPRDRARIRRMQKPARQLQGGLGDLRDLTRFGQAAVATQGAADARRRFIELPSFRKDERKILKLVSTAFRDLRRVELN